MSYFEVQKSWLINDLFKTIYNRPEKLHFPCIQLTFNINVFLLDFIIEPEDEMSFEERLFFGSIDDVLSFIKNSAITEYKIALLSRRVDNDDEYVTSDIIEVIQTRDSANQLAYIYCCRNKKRYIDSLLAHSESDLNQFKTIYQINNK